MQIGNFFEISKNYDRIFCVGDIHGCYQETDTLIDYLVNALSLSKEKDIVIFLGDYIDRGPNSFKVIKSLLRFRSSFPQSRFLKGNHEDMMLSFFGLDGRGGDVYIQNGGATFLNDYNFVTATVQRPNFLDIPEEHRKFFMDLDIGIFIDKFIIAHAGLNPRSILDAQTLEDLLWIRDDFINSIHPFKKTVIFGHTVFSEIAIHLPYKIGIDTGLVYGNKLTCLELKNMTCYQLHKGSKKVISTSPIK